MRLNFLEGKQRELLTKFRLDNNFSNKELSVFLDVKEQGLKKWINETRKLPDNIFDKILRKDKKFEKYSQYILERLPENWGDVRGGKHRVKNIKNLHKYCQEMRTIQDKKRKANHKDYFPNKVFDQLLKEKVNLKAVLAVCILTDGSIVGNRISYYSTDEALKEIVYNIMVRLSSYPVGLHKDKKSGYHIRVSDIRLIKELKKLSPTYKKLPNKLQNKEDYYKEIQPSVKFLDSLDKHTLKWCISFGFSADGCISLSKRNYPSLCLTCYHPSLPSEWKEILDKQGISTNIVNRNTSWCGIDGLKTSKKESIINFQRKAGFVPGVKVTGKSKCYKGFLKSTVLQKAIGIRARGSDS